MFVPTSMTVSYIIFASMQFQLRWVRVESTSSEEFSSTAGLYRTTFGIR